MTTKLTPHQQRRIEAGKGPKSWCECGHTGDGPGSQHEQRWSEGHGPCKVEGCPCRQFTWASWIVRPEPIPEG